jgi:MOSC domain-containing protein YiiM
MAAHIETVCVGRPEIVHHNGEAVSTAIFKSPVAHRVAVGLVNIAGDRQADLSVHGGRDKAVYVYASRHYESWAAELGLTALEPSPFGENLAVSEISEETVVLGSRFRFGSVTAVVAQPRLPCFKLGIRRQDDAFPNRFLASGRLGFYLRVEQTGETGAGDAFELVDRPEHGITVHTLWQTVFGERKDPAAARRCLASLPYLDPGWRRRLRIALSV